MCGFVLLMLVWTIVLLRMLSAKLENVLAAHSTHYVTLCCNCNCQLLVARHSALL